jgi:hypothetical protein
VTTNSVLDLATRSYLSAAFLPDIDNTNTLDVNTFDSLTDKNNPDTFDSLTEEHTPDTGFADTGSAKAQTPADMVPGFFEIDPEDQVTNIHTGGKRR